MAGLAQPARRLVRAQLGGVPRAARVCRAPGQRPPGERPAAAQRQQLSPSQPARGVGCAPVVPHNLVERAGEGGRVRRRRRECSRGGGGGGGSVQRAVSGCTPIRTPPRLTHRFGGPPGLGYSPPRRLAGVAAAAGIAGGGGGVVGSGGRHCLRNRLRRGWGSWGAAQRRGPRAVCAHSLFDGAVAATAAATPAAGSHGCSGGALGCFGAPLPSSPHVPFPACALAAVAHAHQVGPPPPPLAGTRGARRRPLPRARLLSEPTRPPLACGPPGARRAEACLVGLIIDQRGGAGGAVPLPRPVKAAAARSGVRARSLCSIPPVCRRHWRDSPLVLGEGVWYCAKLSGFGRRLVSIPSPPSSDRWRPGPGSCPL